MYRNSWPLLALATYRKLLARAGKVDGHLHPAMASAPAAITPIPRQP